MANLKSLSRKLQTALNAKGIRVRINQYQHYSEKSGRMVTKFVCRSEKMDGTEANEPLITYDIVEVVKYLAGMLRGDGGDA